MSSIVIRYHAIHVNLAVFALLLFLAVLVPALLFRKAYYMHIIQPALVLIAGFTLSVVYSYATEGKKRRFIKRTFSQYMDRQLVEYVLNNPDLIKPGGHRQRVTVFFADIAGFTSISERVAPEDLARMLHSILNAFTEVIIDNGGVIDKYIGDCVMAFWGAPVSREDDEARACNAAIQCINELQKINEDFRAEGLTEISVRIGIHSGDVIAGNLGSDRLFDYTVVGDTVNTASRLESVNKVFKTKIIISGETIQKTSGIFLTRELGLIEVKGKSRPVKIFELISKKEGMGQGAEQTMEMFDSGLAAFRGHRWQDALNIFGSILQKVPGDGPTLFYKEKTESMISHPELTEEVDIIRMKDK
jgi:adenylate cyclase